VSGFWRDRPVLVTGATGLLGGHLVDALLARGARVHVFIRDRAPDCWLAASGALSRVVQVRGELAEYRDVERAVAQYRVRTVFHLGAQAIVGVARRSPWQTFESNARGSWNVLEACRQVDHVDGVVVASSDKVYGPSDDLPYREAHPLNATNPYDVSKAMTDMLARSYAVTYGLPVVTLRCGNLYGPGDLHPDRLIPELTRARLTGAVPTLRSTGRAERDFLWVGDAVAAYLLAGEAADADDVRGRAFNVSGGQPHTVLDVAEAIDRVTGVTEPPRTVLGTAEEEGEIPRQTLDASAFMERFGWRATVELDEGLRRTVDWAAQHLIDAHALSSDDG